MGHRLRRPPDDRVRGGNHGFHLATEFCDKRSIHPARSFEQLASASGRLLAYNAPHAIRRRSGETFRWVLRDWEMRRKKDVSSGTCGSLLTKNPTCYAFVSSKRAAPSVKRTLKTRPLEVLRLCADVSGSLPFCKRALRGFSPLSPFLAARPCPQAARRETFFEGAVGTREVEITILSLRETQKRNLSCAALRLGLAPR